MAGHTTHGYPYALGSDALTDFPAASLELANLLEARLQNMQFRARCKVAQGGSTAAQKLLFTEDAVAPLGVAYNDGGFTFRSAGGVLRDGVYVPRTGFYICEFQAGILANSQAFTMQVQVNASTILPGGGYAIASSGGPTSLVNQFVQVRWSGKLTAGDIVECIHYQNAGAQNLFGDYTTWSIQGRPA